MKSICLLPYCPIPVDSGARAIFNKHLNLLGSLGKCKILSSKRRPVGYGWSAQAIDTLRRQGYEIHFTETTPALILPRLFGIAYALFFKALKRERAFGHSNPYHRYAFDPKWIYNHTKEADLCEIHYSYWARLDTACPKVVIVHDLWSDTMWEGSEKETDELRAAELLVTVSYADKMKLLARGLDRVHWSPPCVDESFFEDAGSIAVVGSDNRHNIEGLKWLIQDQAVEFPDRIHCYGSLSRCVSENQRFIAHGAYHQATDPYQHCGIILMLTKEGTGLQIKGVEALAAGRAIVARKGAMRGLPDAEKGWLEVDTPEEMLAVAADLQRKPTRRKELAQCSRDYYSKYLNSRKVIKSLAEHYREICF